jgi:hypothetical protein
VSNQTTAGTWTATPSRIDIAPFSLPTNQIEIDRNGINQGSVATGFTKVAFNHALFDPDSCFDTVTNFRYQPKVPGKYLVLASAGWQTNPGANETSVVIRKNGADYHVGVDQVSTGFFINTVLGLIDMNGTSDYLEVWLFQGNVSAQTLDGLTSRTWINAQRTGP